MKKRKRKEKRKYFILYYGTPLGLLPFVYNTDCDFFHLDLCCD